MTGRLNIAARRSRVVAGHVVAGHIVRGLLACALVVIIAAVAATSSAAAPAASAVTSSATPTVPQTATVPPTPPTPQTATMPTDIDGDLLLDDVKSAVGIDPMNRPTAAGFVAAALLLVGGSVGLLYRYASGAVASLRRLLSGARSGLTNSSSSAASVPPRSALIGKSAPDSDESESGTTANRDRSGRGSASTSGERAAEPDPRGDPTPPLTDHERVVQLLGGNDGKLPQSEIVAETPWSKSKVSRLLARMDAQGQVVKISAGRQNIIVLPGEEPAGLASLRDRDDD